MKRASTVLRWPRSKHSSDARWSENQSATGHSPDERSGFLFDWHPGLLMLTVRRMRSRIVPGNRGDRGNHFAVGSDRHPRKVVHYRKRGEDRYRTELRELHGGLVHLAPICPCPSSTGPEDRIRGMLFCLPASFPRRGFFTLPAFFSRGGVAPETQPTRLVAHFLFRAVSAG